MIKCLQLEILVRWQKACLKGQRDRFHMAETGERKVMEGRVVYIIFTVFTAHFVGWGHGQYHHSSFETAATVFLRISHVFIDHKLAFVI